MTDFLQECRELEMDLLQRLESLRSEVSRYLGTPDATIRAVPIAEAIEEPAEAHEWVLQNLLATRGIGLIAAQGGVGKSTLMAQVSALVAAGQGVLGFDAQAPRPVLILEAEGSRSMFVERVRVALYAVGIPPAGLPLFIQPREFRPSLNGTLSQTIAQCGAKLVILDTIGLFHEGDENSNTDFKAYVIHPLRRLADQTGAAFMLIHHESKPSELRKGRHQVRGASAMVDDVDLALRLEAPNGDKAPERLLHFDKVRHGPPRLEPMPLHYDSERAIFRQVDAHQIEDAELERKRGADSERIAGIKEKVLKQLRKNPDGMMRSDLLEVVKVREADLRAILEAFEQAGTIYFEPAAGRRGGGGRVWKLSR